MHLLRAFILTFSVTACFAQKQAVSVLVVGIDGKPINDVCIKYVVGGKPFVYLTDFTGKVVLKHDSMSVTATKLGFHLATASIFSFQKITLTEEKTELNQTVITGNNEARTKEKSIQQIQVLGAERIRQLAAPTLKEVLSQQLNTRLGNDPFLGSSISLAGVGGSNIKILIDGIPMIGRENGNIDLSQVNMANVLRIEIVEGPMSVIFGTDALGGVINIITKSSQGKGWKGQANAYIEQKDKWNFDGRLGYTGKKFSYSASLGRYFFGGFASNQDDRVKLWKPKTQWFGDQQLYIKTGKKSYLRLSSSGYHEKLSNKGAVTITPEEAYAFDQYYFTRRWVHSAFFEKIYNKGGKLNIVASFQDYSRARVTYRKDMVALRQVLTASPEDQDTNRFKNGMSRGTYSFKKWNATMQAGYDFSADIATGGRIANGSQQMMNAALFHTADFRLYKKLYARTGLRASWNNRFGSPVTPSIHLKYDIGSNVILRGGYARGFRTPGMKELYLDFVDVNHQVFGNKDLKAEKSDNVNISIHWKKMLKGVKLELNSSGYFNNMRDKIALLADSKNLGSYSYFNFDRFQVLGSATEVSFKWKDYSFVPGYAVNAFRNFNLTGKEKYSPNQEWTMKLGRSFKKAKAELAIFYKHTGRYTFYQLNEDQKTYFKNSMSAFDWLDINLGKFFWKNKIYVAVGGKNLLGITNVTANLYNGPHTGGSSAALVGYGRVFYVNLISNF